MDRDHMLARFRAHATARLTRNDTEALRLALDLDEHQRLHHLLYVLMVFGAIVFEHLGDRPDPEDLAALTKRLHHKHHQAGNGFNALRAEAMIRAVCGDEAALLTEIPHTEQPGYMWAVMTELVDPNITDQALTDLLDLAEATRDDTITRTLEQPMFKPAHTPPTQTPPPQQAPATGEAPAAGQAPESAPEGATE